MLQQISKQTHTHIHAPTRQQWQELRGPLTVLAAFAAVYLFWGSTFLAIHFAIDSIPPFLMAGSRFVIAGAILYIWARWRGAPRPQRLHWRTAFITGGLMQLGGNGIVGWAEQYVPSSMAGLLVATVPMWVVVIGVVLNRERPSWAVIAALGLGLLGVGLLFRPGGLASGDSRALTAMLILLAACFSWALGTHYSRTAAQPTSLNMATGMNLLAGGFLLFVFSGINGEYAGFDITAVTFKSAMAVLYLVVFGSIIGFSAYMWLVKTTTPARASSNFYVNPVVAVFLGWLLVDEPITTTTLVAAAVIIGAVIMIVSQKKPAKAK
ncbi:MAG: EamA family transporter [Chloroflexota bacterium]